MAKKSASRNLTASAVKSPEPSPLWTEQEYAAYVRKSINSVRKDRAKGLGPRFKRIVGAVRYLPSDIFAYLDANTCTPARRKSAQ